MRLVRPAMVFAASIALTACQTANGMRVNGINIHPAQGETFCERNAVMCLLGGAAVAGGVAFAAMGHGYHSSSGPGGMGMPGSGY